MSLFELDVADQIMMSKIKLQRNSPFFAYILMNMRITPTKKDSFINTMGVNEIGDLFYNEDFVKSLQQEEINGVLAHEAMHIATATFPRRGKRDHLLWNIATDYIINYLLLKEGFTLPKGICRPDANGNIVIKAQGPGTKDIVIPVTDESFAEDLYDRLQQHRDQVLKAMGITEITIGVPGQCDGSGSMPGDGDGKMKRVNGQFDFHLDGDQTDTGESQGKLKTAADRHANEQLWKGRSTEAAVAAKTRGKMSSSMERHIGELLEPKIDWRKRLLSFVTRDLPIDYTMRLPGRRTQALGIYFPSVIRENVEIFVAVDVSGSIGGDEYRQFMSEVLGIARSFAQVKMKIIFWSTYVDPADDLDLSSADEDKLLTHVVKNSGGTTMTCVRDYCKKNNYNPRMIVFLTDGCIEPDPKFLDGSKNFFVLSANSDDSIVQKHGEVCKLGDVERDPS